MKFAGGKGSNPPSTLSGKLNSIWDAAANSSQRTSCGVSLSTPALFAMILAPAIAEGPGSGVTTEAPHPMMLSRGDAYIMNTNDGWKTREDNKALYFRGLTNGVGTSSDIDSGHHRIFWHPGIGMWQIDHGGWNNGTQLTEITWGRFVPHRTVADWIAYLYCHAPSGYSKPQRRASAFGPWVACRKGARCENDFKRLYNESTNSINWGEVSGVTTLTTWGGDADGNRWGAKKATCTINVPAWNGTKVSRKNLTCVEVDAANEASRNAFDWWFDSGALNPSGGYTSSSTGQYFPGRTPSPLSKQFYVYAVKRDTTMYEFRTWGAPDTGLSTNVTTFRKATLDSRKYLKPYRWKTGGRIEVTYLQ